MYYVPRCILNLSYTSCTDEDDVPSTLKLRPLLTGLGWPPLLPPLFSGRRAPPPTPFLVIMSNAANSDKNFYCTRTVFTVYIVLKSSSKSVLYKNIIRTIRARETKNHRLRRRRRRRLWLRCVHWRVPDTNGRAAVNKVHWENQWARTTSHTRATYTLIHDTYDDYARTRIRPTAVSVQYDVYVTINKYVFFFFLSSTAHNNIQTHFIV